MRTPAWRPAMIVGAGVLVLGSCGVGRQASPPNGHSDWPAVLRYNVYIGQENPDAEAGRLQPIQRYLQSQLNMPVVVTGTSGYGTVVEALRARKIEAASMGSFTYLIASEKAGVEAIANRGSMDGQPGVYYGMLAVARNSPLRTVDDFIRHSKELTLSFVDPASSSGYLVQRVYLDSIGLDPERDLKKVLFSNNHMASALTLVAGKVDVAAISNKDIPGLIGQGKLREGDIRAIWTSPGIPEGPIAVRKDLPEAFKRKLQAALLEMPARAPEAYENMTARMYKETYKNMRLVAISDALFEPLRQLARSVKQVQLLER